MNGTASSSAKGAAFALRGMGLAAMVVTERKPRP